MTTHNFCFYLQNRLIQTSQTGGQWYSDASPFSIPWLKAVGHEDRKQMFDFVMLFIVSISQHEINV